ncbi:MAG: hypothetical protein EXS36_04385 [Pedosphaera sp.]|nr:hypothetical protein [Pedosphaera sp.]
MKLGLRLIAGMLLVVGVALWFFGGLNCGWTKTYEEDPTTDAVTNLTYSERRYVFRPGLEFLGATALAAGLLAALSCMFPTAGNSGVGLNVRRGIQTHPQ